MSKRVLITGGGGFIGHHFVEHILETTDWTIVVLDSFKHKGTYSRLDEVMEGFDEDKIRSRLYWFQHNLNAPIDLALEAKLGSFDYVINLASNSAVERSVSGMRECWENNCNIAINMVEWATRQLNLEWFLHVSTDEVYGAYKGNDNGHMEWDIIEPTNPYAASKAAQEALMVSAKYTNNLPVILTNTMNNFGERQDPEKFIPRIIGQIYREETLEIYTSPSGEIGSRHYLHCKDHADAVVHLLGNPNYRLASIDHESPVPRFNIAGGEEFDNLEVANMVARLMGKDLKYRKIVPSDKRPTYDLRYGLNPGKMASAGWEPPKGFEAALIETIDFTLENQQWMGES